MHHQIYSEVLNALNLKGTHEKDLLKRGFTLNQIQANQYKTLPKTGLQAKSIHSIAKTIEKLGFSLTDAAGFYLEKGRKNPDLIKPFYKLKKDSDKKFCDAILVPVRDKFGEIQAVKLRLDTTVTARKYKYLSSKGYPKGKGHIPQLHWPLGFNDAIDTIRVTEGEFKADYTTLHSSTYTVSIPGVTMWRLALEEIKRLPNIKKILLAPDADKSDSIDPYTKKKLKKNEANQVARSFACLANELIGLGYDVLMEDWDESCGKGIDDVLLAGHAPRTMTQAELDEFILEHGKPSFPHSVETQSGWRLLPTKENAKALCDFLGVNFRYNKMKHLKEVFGNNRSQFYPDNLNNAVIQLKSKASLYGMPTLSLADLVDVLAADEAYHPAKDWVESEQWDGVSRIRELMDTLAVEKGWEETRDIYMKRWLISGIAALYKKNYWTKIVLTLVGAGSIGKTTWFEKLFGSISLDAFKDGLILDPSNKDSRFAVISNWCVELGELSATFRKKDREELKAFITERADDYRAPYGRESVRYPRQCFFGASVDQAEFLKDEAGDIRFACLPVESIELDHDINMQQLWVEVRDTLFLKGETWFLEAEELKMIKESNEQFRVVSPIDEIIQEAYGDKSRIENHGGRWITASGIARELENLNYIREKQFSAPFISKSIAKEFDEKEKSMKSKKAKQFYLPPIMEIGGPDLVLVKGSDAEKESIDKTDDVMKPDTI